MEHASGRYRYVRNLSDMRLKARGALPRAIFDYIDGAAEDELSRRRNRAQFDRWGFVQRSAVDVSQIDTSTTLLGQKYAVPFGIGPTGLAGLAWPRAESILAASAHRAQVPFCLSTVASVTIEEAAQASGAGNWFQLYIFRDRGLSRALLNRAKAAGYTTLVITVDCATGGNRERDPLNDFTLPLRPTHRNVFNTAMRPAWLLRLARNGPPRPENMVEAAAKAAQNAQGLVAFMTEQLDPSVSWDDVAEFAALWDGPVVVKGVLATDDVLRARQAGADGVVISNHGGRQLDGAVSPLSVLEEIRAATGPSMTLLCDSGFRRGADILKAIALGADGVLMGRNTLYGVAVGGASGVGHVLHILRSELERAMALLGTPTLADVTHDHIKDLGHWDRSHP